MVHSPYVFDATADNFVQLVLQNSDKGPVLVNYWSPRAGPCFMLMPRLVRLATEFGGRFLLVMLNTDELGRLARDQGVTSLPTVKVFRHGRVIATLHGAESEAALRAFVRQHVDSSAAELRLAALTAHEGGDTDQAVAMAAEAALAEPDNPRLALDVAKLLILQGRPAQADNLLTALPAVVRADPEIRTLHAHIRLIRAAQAAPPVPDLERAIGDNPGDLPARFQLAAVHVTRDDYDAAMQQLLEIVRRDRHHGEDAGHDALLALFALLGEDDERVRRYRALLAQALR